MKTLVLLLFFLLAFSSCGSDPDCEAAWRSFEAKATSLKTVNFDSSADEIAAASTPADVRAIYGDPGTGSSADSVYKYEVKSEDQFCGRFVAQFTTSGGATKLYAINRCTDLVPRFGEDPCA